MVVGNISSGALPTSVSPSGGIFQGGPYGVPCASEAYQSLPSGETATLWGRSMAAGMMPTGTTLTVRSAAPSQASWVTMSPDSLVTRMRKSGPCWAAARPLASTASARIEENCFTGAAKDRDRKSTRLNSSHSQISYAVFCLKKKKIKYKIFLHQLNRGDFGLLLLLTVCLVLIVV